MLRRNPYVEDTFVNSIYAVMYLTERKYLIHVETT